MRALPTGPWEAAPPGLAAAPADADWELRNATISHVFTHFRLTCALAVARDGAHETAGEWLPIDRLEEAGIPTLFLKAARVLRGGGGVRSEARRVGREGGGKVTSRWS